LSIFQGKSQETGRTTQVGNRPPGGCVGAADWMAQNAEYRSCRPAVGNLPYFGNLPFPLHYAII